MLKSTTNLVERLADFGFGQLRRTSKYLPLLVLLSFSGLQVNAKVDDKASADTFTRLQACVETTTNKFSDDSSDTMKLAVKIKKDSDVLLEKWTAATNRDVPKDYLQTLQLNCELLANAATEKDSEKAKSLLQDVSADLDVKAKQARRQVGASESLGASIRVSVKTRRNGQEVDGYLVRCNPKRYGTQTSAMFVFNNPTNQAERILPPGNYVFWLETQRGEFVTSRPITVGGNGETSIPAIWFDVP